MNPSAKLREGKSAGRPPNPRPGRKGSTFIEFALCFALLAPLVAGVGAVGLALARYLQVTSVCRSTGSMFVRGVDFSQVGMQRVLVQLSGSLGLGTNGTINNKGKGVITVTQVLRVGSSECGGLPVGTSCTNRGRVVVIKQLRLGNTALNASFFGSPYTSGAPGWDGSVPVMFYLTDSRAAVAAFGTAASDNVAVPGDPVDLRAGETAYASEAFFSTEGMNPFPAIVDLNGLYSRNFY